MSLPTLEGPVESRGEGVPQHDHGGVDDDLPAPPPLAADLSLTPAAVQAQGHLVVVAIQDHLVPLAVVQAIGGQREVVVTVTQVVQNAEEPLIDLERGR